MRCATKREQLGHRPRRRQIVAVGLLAAVMPFVTPAGGAGSREPWVPFDCTSVSGRAETETAPLSDAEVVQAFEAQARARLLGGPWRALLDEAARTTADALSLENLLAPPAPGDPDRSALAEGIRKHALQYRVVRAVSWKRSRCSGEPGRRTALYLEAPLPCQRLKRVSALLSGRGKLLSYWIAWTGPSGSRPKQELPTLEDAEERLAVEAGGEVADVEYILADGYPSCYAIPCVAAHRGNTLYLLEARGRVFAFPLEPHTREEAFPSSGRPCIGAPCLGDPWVLQIGDKWLAGRLLCPSAPSEMGQRGRSLAK